MANDRKIVDLERIVDEWLSENGEDVSPVEVIGFFRFKLMAHEENIRFNLEANNRKIQEALMEKYGAPKKTGTGKGH